MNQRGGWGVIRKMGDSQADEIRQQEHRELQHRGRSEMILVVNGVLRLDLQYVGKERGGREDGEKPDDTCHECKLAISSLIQNTGQNQHLNELQYVAE